MLAALLLNPGVSDKTPVLPPKYIYDDTIDADILDREDEDLIKIVTLMVDIASRLK